MTKFSDFSNLWRTGREVFEKILAIDDYKVVWNITNLIQFQVTIAKQTITIGSGESGTTIQLAQGWFRAVNRAS